jgi:hypothetical protein
MSKKKKEENARREREEVTGLVEREQTELQKIDELFAEVEKTEDVAKKILKLESLRSHIKSVRKKMDRDLSNVAYRVAPHKMGYNAQLEAKEEKERQLPKENPALSDSYAALDSHQSRAFEMLAETVRRCNLGEVKRSDWYSGQRPATPAASSAQPAQIRLRTPR